MIDPHGRTAIEDKASVKSALGKSPDLAEALMLAIGEPPHEPGCSPRYPGQARRLHSAIICWEKGSGSPARPTKPKIKPASRDSDNASSIPGGGPTKMAHEEGTKIRERRI